MRVILHYIVLCSTKFSIAFCISEYIYNYNIYKVEIIYVYVYTCIYTYVYTYNGDKVYRSGSGLAHFKIFVKKNKVKNNPPVIVTQLNNLDKILTLVPVWSVRFNNWLCYSKMDSPQHPRVAR